MGLVLSAVSNGNVMSKGRKSTPVSIKLLMGNPGKRAIKNAPQAEDELPDCPAWLDDIAREEWERLAGGIPWVRGADASTLEAYCAAYSRWRKAEEEMREPGKGFTADTSTGGIKRHPLVGIALESAAQMKAMAAELGLTPSSRTRIGTTTAAPGAKLKKFIG